MQRVGIRKESSKNAKRTRTFPPRGPLVVADGNLVLVGSEGYFGPVEEMPYAVFYDLFRVEDGQLVEHWDVIPELPPLDSIPHDNGLF